MAATVIVCIGVAAGIFFFAKPSGKPSTVSVPVASVPGTVPIKPSVESRPTIIPGSRFSLVSGEVLSENNPVSAGSGISTSQRIRTGRGQAAISLPTGIAAGLSENTSVRVLWNGTRRYGLSILSGMVLFSVDPEQSRGDFFVDTAAGTVHVRGTLFTVVVSPEDGVYVKLHRGKVWVEKPDGLRQVLVPGEIVRLDGERGVAQNLNRKVLEQLRTTASVDQGRLFTELSRDVVESTEAEVSRTSPVRGNGKFVNRLSIRDLMGLARNQKTDGNWEGAASSYASLIHLHPKSDEARTSMVSLARIQLNHLNNPRGALQHFSRYLKQKGPLTQEALYGRAEALRALGDRRREKQALLTFLEAYPEGLYAKSVRKRLDALRSAVEDRP